MVTSFKLFIWRCCPANPCGSFSGRKGRDREETLRFVSGALFTFVERWPLPLSVVGLHTMSWVSLDPSVVVCGVVGLSAMVCCLCWMVCCAAAELFGTSFDDCSLVGRELDEVAEKTNVDFFFALSYVFRRGQRTGTYSRYLGSRCGRSVVFAEHSCFGGVVRCSV